MFMQRLTNMDYNVDTHQWMVEMDPVAGSQTTADEQIRDLQLEGEVCAIRYLVRDDKTTRKTYWSLSLGMGRDSLAVSLLKSL